MSLLKKLNIDTNQNYLSHYLRRENNNFDLMRLIVALMVIIHHAPTLSQIPVKMLTNNATIMGDAAVGFFFFLSGIVVTNSFLSKPSLIYYTVSRTFRIWPALTFVLLISVFIIGPLATTYSLADYFTSQETRQYLHFNFKVETRFLLPGVFDNNLMNNSINGSLWTIRWEVKAYFMLIILLYGFTRFKKFPTIAFIIITVLLLGLITSLIEPLIRYLPFNHWLPLTSKDVFNGDEIHPVWRAARPFFILFYIGALLSILKERIKINNLTCLASILFVILSYSLIIKRDLIISAFDFPANEYDHITLFLKILSFSLLLIHLSLLPLINRFHPKIDISYGIYIWAFPLAQLVEYYLPNLNLLTNIVLVIALSLCMGWFSWTFIEAPFLQLGKKLSPYLIKVYLDLKSKLLHFISSIKTKNDSQ